MIDYFFFFWIDFETIVFNLPEPKSIPMDLQSRRSKTSSSTHYPKRALVFNERDIIKGGDDDDDEKKKGSYKNYSITNDWFEDKVIILFWFFVFYKGESGIHEKKMQQLVPAPIDLAE